MLERVDGAFAEAAGGSVDYAQERDGVVGILYHFQVGDEVFDFGALVERESADHFVFQAVAAHGFFKQPRLRIGAIEHGGAWSLAAVFILLRGLAQIFGDVVGGEKCFVLAVWGFVVADFGPALARGPKVFAFAADVVGDHGGCSLQNVLGGAVVLFEADNLGLGKILLELENVANVSAAPGINRLIFVAHGADVVALAGQHAHEFVLRTVGVLIFVDEQILEAAVVIFAHGCRRLHQASGFEQQVVEIEGVGLA